MEYFATTVNTSDVSGLALTINGALLGFFCFRNYFEKVSAKTI